MSERRSCRPLARSRPASRARARMSIQLCGMKPPALATPTISVPAPFAAPCSGVISGRSRSARQPGSLICPMHQSRRHCSTPSAVLAASWSRRVADEQQVRTSQHRLAPPCRACALDARGWRAAGEPSFTSIGAIAACRSTVPHLARLSARPPERRCGRVAEYESTLPRLAADFQKYLMFRVCAHAAQQNYLNITCDTACIRKHNSIRFVSVMTNCIDM